MMVPDMLDIAGLRALYASGAATPLDVIETVITRLAACPDQAVWISRFDDDHVRAAARALMAGGAPGADQPLWGIPFAIKDNIDCAGLPTTAACPAFAYHPERDSAVVARLRAAGAIPIGKTNLDQFATGLNGTRSPHGAPRSVIHADYVSGGSSSGSAVAVAGGLVSFALGTDTAGSGRVPAAFNNIIGVKPTKGLLSNRGAVPACRSLDCITVFSLTVSDADLVRQIAQGYDRDDPFSRPPLDQALPLTAFRFGVLTAAEREFYGDHEAEALYDQAIARLESLGGTAVPFDYAPFRKAALLLYGGPWVAERLAAIEEFFTTHEAELDPTVRAIIGGARGKTAVDAFNGVYALEGLKRRAEREWQTGKLDLLLLPTAPTLYTVAAMQADPITLNSRFGHYTNFVNLFDYCGIAVPAGFRADGLPFGVTLIGPAFADRAIAVLGDRLHRAGGFGVAANRTAAIPGSALPADRPARYDIAVVGAHLTGMPLNHQLTSLGGTLVRPDRTAGDYKLYALTGSAIPKPGLVRVPGFAGDGIAVEIWSLDAAGFGRFVPPIQAPLGIGKVTLADGSAVSGFLCEAHAVTEAEDITAFGGWRAYIASRS